jgi:hypothetical protein
MPLTRAKYSKTCPIFGPIQPECLVPLEGGDGRMTGVVVLGTRRSEEPYSREDKRLLATVANLLNKFNPAARCPGAGRDRKDCLPNYWTLD